MDLGSNVLWSSTFEGGNFDEWTSVPDARVDGIPPNSTKVSSDYAHHGKYAAVLGIDAGSDGTQQNASLDLRGQPVEAYYSAWYYLPRTISVGTFWLISKFRLRTNATDPSSSQELFDFRLSNARDGSLTLSIYDHRTGKELPLVTPAPVVPVSVWFQVEAFYRNAQDATGQLTVWLDGRKVVDLQAQPMAPNPWVEWDVVNVGVNLTPSAATVVVDDCAITLSRVGPTGTISP